MKVIYRKVLIISAAMALMAFGLIEMSDIEKSNPTSTEKYSANIPVFRTFKKKSDFSP